MDAIEEQFVLRVEPEDLAHKLRKWLREEQGLTGRVELTFGTGHPRHGTLTVEGTAYPATLLDLPAVVESYKTLDDVNLVKLRDVGQLLLVQAPGATRPQSAQSADGVTPAMRAAGLRQFRPPYTVDRATVTRIEAEVAELLKGGCPEGWTIHDLEEEYQVDPHTGDGMWVPAKKKAAPKAAAGGRRKAAAPVSDDGGDAGDDEEF